LSVITVRVAGFSHPRGLDIKDLCSKLNRLQNFYRFEYLGSSENVPDPDLPHNRHSFRQLEELFYTLYPRPEENSYDVMLTQKRMEEDYFSKPQGRLGLVSSSDTDLILRDTRKSVEKYFAFLIVDVLGWIQFNAEHDADEEDVGCLFDGCYDSRSTIVLSLNECIICNNCVDNLKRMSISNEQLEAITEVLSWVKRPPMSSYFKWALSISLLFVGAGFVLTSVYTDIGIVALGASGWVVTIIDRPWPILER
jgi:preprotein translocase subunit Sss1